MFWTKGEDAVQMFFQQFYERRVVDPKKPPGLTYEQQSKSLA